MQGLGDRDGEFASKEQDWTSSCSTGEPYRANHQSISCSDAVQWHNHSLSLTHASYPNYILEIGECKKDWNLIVERTCFGGVPSASILVSPKNNINQKSGTCKTTEKYCVPLTPITVALRIKNIKTLDLSKNSLASLSPNISLLVNLKSLNLDHNKLPAGSLIEIAKLSKLQNLSVGGNELGKHVAPPADPLPPALPSGLKHLKLNNNFLSNVPRPILSASLSKLEKLDLSGNQLAAIPGEVSNLLALTELDLDGNVIVSLPSEIGSLKRLKVLSLKRNRISVDSTSWSEKNPQPLPKELFADTPIIDLNLHGNPMTSTQLNSMEGFDTFLERRQKVKTSTLMGGGLTNLDVCGLE